MSIQIENNNNLIPTIELYFDIGSPFSFFAFDILFKYKYHLNYNFNYILKPIYLGGLFKEVDNSFKLVPIRANYLNIDVVRTSNHLGYNFQIPSFFPINSLLIQRLITILTLITDQNSLLTFKLCKALWLALWERGLDITQLEILEQISVNETALLKKSEKGFYLFNIYLFIYLIFI
eukprot:TRINITY_DN99_c0_g2_i1.p1 TRINITY_DN99_c0_g2~~TRINITY_DN99_c0_g2_i1.p1  ORF type:complete len:177 (-),score=57.90 TRINITY_DN99_c0_g2_i1:57-587(-)